MSDSGANQNLANHAFHNANGCMAGGTLGTGSYTTGYSVLGGPSYSQTPSYYPYVKDELRIRKVENGYILSYSGKEYVCINHDQVAKYLKLLDKPA